MNGVLAWRSIDPDGVLALSAATDRALVRLYWPVALRPAFDALFAIDDAMADVVRTTREPALGAIRLAWWREALEALDHSPPPAEPRLEAAAGALISHGIHGADLAGLEDGWRVLLDPFPWSATATDNGAAAVLGRGARLFVIGAKLLGAEDGRLADAGACWALSDAARHCTDSTSAEGLVDLGKGTLRGLADHRFAKPLRALTALSALASRDLARRPSIEPEATPGRAFVLLHHRLTGRLRPD